MRHRKIRHHIKHHFVRNAAFFVFVSVFAGVYLLSNSVRDNTPEIVYIKAADDQTIVRELDERGFFKNRLSYWLVATLAKFDEGIQSGGYELSRNASAVAIYSELKNPTHRYIAIAEGLRKEEIAEVYGKALNWDEATIAAFQETPNACIYSGREGRLYPGEYLVSKNVSIQKIQDEMERNFANAFSAVISTEKEKTLDEDQIVIVASLIQREAAGAHDMRLISGIIWNRIFKGMPLQIDATLQYVKGDDGKWWPQVKSEDKYVESPFNTYQNEGLPPAPIANPGKAALDAAANPLPTDCLFYLHDHIRTIHCSPTYEGHLLNIKNYL